MNIVLTCIHNFQTYIIDNIQQLLRTGNTDIYVIINKRFENNFQEFSGKVKLVFVEDLVDEYNFIRRCPMSGSFREGFFILTSARFFYIYALMKRDNLKNVIHLENDVVIYYNCSILKDKLDTKYIYLPFDTFRRNIASIMYIPDYATLKSVLDEYNYTINDMENFSILQQKTGVIRNFPIFIDYTSENKEIQFVSKNYDIFNFVFDAAAIGQYIGGVDPRNIPGDTTGFINETCVIKYNTYSIIWKTDGGSYRKPFLIVNKVHIPIFNLHIHSKQLSLYV